MYTGDYKWRVRYADTDKMGYLYYGNYPTLYEIGRVELIRNLGLSYREMEEEYKIMMPVVALEARYILPAKYDEELTIRTILQEKPGRLINFDCEIFNENNVLIHKALIKLAFINIEDNKSVSCPEFLMRKLLPYFEDIRK